MSIFRKPAPCQSTRCITNAKNRVSGANGSTNAIGSVFFGRICSSAFRDGTSVPSKSSSSSTGVSPRRCKRTRTTRTSATRRGSARARTSPAARPELIRFGWRSRLRGGCSPVSCARDFSSVARRLATRCGLSRSHVSRSAPRSSTARARSRMSGSRRPSFDCVTANASTATPSDSSRYARNLSTVRRVAASSSRPSSSSSR